MPTLRHRPPTATPTLDPLWAALLGLVAGLSLGSHVEPLLSLLALLGSP